MGETVNQAWLREMRDGLRNFFPVNPAEMDKHEVIGLAWRLHRTCGELLELLAESRHANEVLADAVLALATEDVPAESRDLMLIALSDASAAARATVNSHGCAEVCAACQGRLARALLYDRLAGHLRDVA